MGMRQRMRHLFNPLHVYCRLRDLGMSHLGARRVCGVYERFIYRSPLC